MKQIIFIDGACILPNEERLLEVLKTWSYDPKRERKLHWIYWIQEKLISEYETFRPPMPNTLSASYVVWKLWFEKVLKVLNDEEVILIGHSLGSTFLTKYIGETGFPQKIKQLHLVSTMLDTKGMRDEDSYMGNFAFEPEIIPNLEKVCEEIFLYHSTDDPTVPYDHTERIKSYLPHAQVVTFTDKGHFGQETFPALLENIRK